jgi:hypothetical protein
VMMPKLAAHMRPIMPVLMLFSFIVSTSRSIRYGNYLVDRPIILCGDLIKAFSFFEGRYYPQKLV